MCRLSRYFSFPILARLLSSLHIPEEEALSIMQDAMLLEADNNGINTLLTLVKPHISNDITDKFLTDAFRRASIQVIVD